MLKSIFEEFEQYVLRLYRCLAGLSSQIINAFLVLFLLRSERFVQELEESGIRILPSSERAARAKIRIKH